MKLVIGYPPFKGNGTPQISQNRQMNWNRAGTVIYPVVMATAATMMNNSGWKVIWLDGIAERMTWDEYLARLFLEDPDYILWETKTPVIKKTWEYVNEVKELLPDVKVILCGDHVTALPHETIQNCGVDHLLKGGDYDIELRKLLGYPIPPTPIINRSLTRYALYSKHNGNFAHTPGTYTQFSRDCWHRDGGGCTFCSWTNLYRDCRNQTPEDAMGEVEACASLGIKEIFDDSGTFPCGAWMQDFCERLIKFNKRRKYAVTMGCNMRAGVLKKEDWKLLKSAGFRLVLMGLESANETTLERLNKGYGLHDITESFKLGSESGLAVHGTALLGLPWESKEDAERTIGFTRDLFKRGHAKTIQATVCVPYPGTQLFKEAKEKGWLLTEDWDKYDQSQAVMRVDGYDPVKMARSVYASCITPRFIWRTITSESPRTILRYAGYLVNHLR